MRSPLSRVRGLGAAKDGVGHWWSERLTSIALVPLCLWFVYAVVGLTGADHGAFTAWLGNHGNAMMMVLLVVVLFHHAQLGLQVVIEDYVHGEFAKLTGIITVKFIAAFAALSAVLAVLRIAFGN